MTDQPPVQHPLPSRRDFIAISACACGAAAVGVPALAALASPPPPSMRASDTGGSSPGAVAISKAELDAGALKDLNKPRALSVVAESLDGWRVSRREIRAFAVRTGDAPEAISVLSAICPHAGCLVDFSAKDKRFECPCHKAAFAPDGARIDGPAPRGMYVLVSKVTPRGLEVWPG